MKWAQVTITTSQEAADAVVNDLTATDNPKEIILDTDAVIRLKDADQLIEQSEIPVITETTVAELRALVNGGRLRGMP